MDPKNPKNLQAILDWCDVHRPDLKPVVEHEKNNDGFILLMTVGFEAGRQFQREHPSVTDYLDFSASSSESPPP